MNNLLPTNGWFVESDGSEKYKVLENYITENSNVCMCLGSGFYGQHINNESVFFSTDSPSHRNYKEITIDDFNILVQPVGKNDDAKKFNKDLKKVMLKIPKHSDAKVCELLDVLIKTISEQGIGTYGYAPITVYEICNHETLQQFKIDNGLIKEPKPKLEVGKWYYHKGNTFSDETSFFCITSISERGNVYGYGFDEKNEWIKEIKENGSTCMSNDVAKKYLVQATDKEVLEALTKEAEKRGFILNETICVDSTPINKDWNECMSISAESIEFEDNILRFNGCRIMHEGKWAKVVEEPKVNELTIPELEKLTGLTNIKIIK